MRILGVQPPPPDFYPELVQDWLRNNGKLTQIYPNPLDTPEQVAASYDFFGSSRREELARIFRKQYQDQLSPETAAGINSLLSENTYTVTTGQQIHIFLGPLFVMYKAWSVIRQAKALEARMPGKNIVPVFWMATEDHDLAEINHLTVFGKSFIWQPEATHGPVGRLDTAALKKTGEELAALAGQGQDFSGLLAPFTAAYQAGNSLAVATRQLLNHYFGKYGLLVLDPDDPELKEYISPLLTADILNGSFEMPFKRGMELLQEHGYKPQVNARPVHFFRVVNGSRERVDRDGENFRLQPSGAPVTKAEMQFAIEHDAAAFSPNALMRPLYQQAILPNLGYVCGPSEMIYWHQLYPGFEVAGIPAPMLFLRDSYTILDQQAAQLSESLKIAQDVLWTGFENAAEMLQNRLAGENKLAGLLTEYQRLNETLKSELYKVKSPSLKDVVKQTELLMSMMKKENQNVISNFRNTEPYAADFRKLSKLISKYYDVKNPQERTEFWMNQYLKNGMSEMPEFGENQYALHLFAAIGS